MASRAVIKEIENFAQQVRACDVSLGKVILFGSYSTNKQTRYGDMDVAILADEFTGVPG